MDRKLAALSFVWGCFGLAVSGPALAAGYSGPAWLESCVSDGEVAHCALLVPGGRMIVWDDGATPIELLDQLRMLGTGTALRIMGEISDEGDGVSRSLVLGAVEQPGADRFQPIIAGLQGDWAAEDGSANSFTLKGGDWWQTGPDAQSEVYIASFDVTCADGRAVAATPQGSGQMALIAYASDPVTAPICLQVSVEPDRITLTPTGSDKPVAYARIPGQPYEGPGYFLGCDTEGFPVFCHLQTGSFNLSFSLEDTDPAIRAVVEGLTHLQPVNATGTLSDMSDASAILDLTTIAARNDDPFATTVVALQGLWKAADGAPFALVDIDGLDWLQTDADDSIWGAALLVDHSCVDGAKLDGSFAVVLRPYGQDPLFSLCWGLVSVDAANLVIKDLSGAMGQVTLTRQPDQQ